MKYTFEVENETQLFEFLDLIKEIETLATNAPDNKKQHILSICIDWQNRLANAVEQPNLYSPRKAKDSYDLYQKAKVKN